jgi:hypothetical protein
MQALPTEAHIDRRYRILLQKLDVGRYWRHTHERRAAMPSEEELGTKGRKRHLHPMLILRVGE